MHTETNEEMKNDQKGICGNNTKTTTKTKERTKRGKGRLKERNKLRKKERPIVYAIHTLGPLYTMYEHRFLHQTTPA